MNTTDAEDINTFDTFSLALVLGLLDIIPKYDGIHPAAAILRPDFWKMFLPLGDSQPPAAG